MIIEKHNPDGSSKKIDTGSIFWSCVGGSIIVTVLAWIFKK
jgi:hypothetical protein